MDFASGKAKVVDRTCEIKTSSVGCACHALNHDVATWQLRFIDCDAEIRQFEHINALVDCLEINFRILTADNLLAHHFNVQFTRIFCNDAVVFLTLKSNVDRHCSTQIIWIISIPTNGDSQVHSTFGSLSAHQVDLCVNLPHREAKVVDRA